VKRKLKRAKRVLRRPFEWLGIALGWLVFAHVSHKMLFRICDFIAAVGYDRFTLTRLYPEQGSELRMPRLPGGVFYVCCGAHGLFRIRKR